MSTYGPSKPKSKKAQLLLSSLLPSDVDGRYLVLVRITPIMPAQDLQRAQLAQAFRTPGVDKRPLVDDDYIRTAVLELEHAEQIAERIDQQQLPMQSQEIQQLVQGAAEWDWKQNNPDIVAKAQKQQEASAPGQLNPTQMSQMLAIMQKHLGGAQGLPDMLGATPPPGGGGPAPMGAPMGAGPVPPGVGPSMGGPMLSGPGGAPPPSLMPSQTNMSPEQVMPNPVTLPARQAKRGKAQHQKQ